MTFDPVLWAMKDAPVADVEEWAVLVSLAERADDDGCNAYPAHATIAERLRMSVPTVKRRLESLESRGLIRRGDQSAVAHIRADRRPVVWELMIPLSWFPNVARIQSFREEKGRPKLTARSRPDLGEAPAPRRRADVGKPRSDRSTRARVLVDPGFSESDGSTSSVTGGLVVHDGGSTRPTTFALTLPTDTPQRTTSLPARSANGDDDPKPDRPSKPKTPRGTRVPDDFTPTPEMTEWARRECPTVGMRDHDKFMDYWRAQPGARGVKTDWPATWRNWMRKTHDEGKGMGGYVAGQPGAAPRSTTNDRVMQGLDLAQHFAALDGDTTTHALQLPRGTR